MDLSVTGQEGRLWVRRPEGAAPARCWGKGISEGLSGRQWAWQRLLGVCWFVQTPVGARVVGPGHR